MTGLTSGERECVERATGAQAAMLANVEAWAAINSGSRNLDGLARVAHQLADAFAVLPGDVKLVDPAPVEAIDATGRAYDLAHGQHLHLQVRPDAPVQILLTGHMDTVFAADHPFQSLTWLDAGTLGGPGVADMKGGIAVMLAALQALETSPAAQSIGYEVVLNSDEEVGSLASAAVIAQVARGKRAALTFEPSALPDGTLAGARPGSGNFSFTVRGKAAHAGRNPEDGRNALVAAADLALRLKAAAGPGLSVNPAKIDGGGPTNVVPDLAVLRVNVRPATIDDQARAQSLIDAAVAMVASGHDVAIDTHGHFARPPKPMNSELEALFGLVRQAGADLPVDRLATDWRGVRRQQHRRLRRPGDRHDGRSRRKHSFDGGISDRRKLGRTRGAGRAHPIAPGRRAMTFRIRAASPADIRALYDLSKLTGGGFTNLPADRATLEAKLEKSQAGFEREGENQADDLFLFVLENVETKAIRGTCQVFGEVGSDRPFFSYRLSTLTQKSEELGRIFRNQTLTLTTDLEGSSEVGGLFLHPHERAGGLGMLLARSRYLFIKQHRPRFGARILAELRGVMDQAGHSPFWDALAGRFFGMSFPEADEFNAVHGTQFIADLMPKTPIYVAMLPDSARSVMGQPHPTGRAALRMLESEGFTYDCYIDIFDGGPTVTAATDKIRTIENAQWLRYAGSPRPGGADETMVLASGRLDGFVACYGKAQHGEEGQVLLDDQTAELLRLDAGDVVLATKR